MSKRLAVAVALALPIASLVEIAGVAIDARTAPRPDDFAAVRDRVAAEHHDGDAIAIDPAWAEPNARAAWGDALFPIRELARPDDDRLRRLLVVATPRARPNFPGFREIETRPLSLRLELHVLENQHPVTVVTDLVDEVEAGRAEVAAPGGACPFRTDQRVVTEGLFGSPALPSARFACGAEPWQSVGVTVQDDEGWRPRRCVWAHPEPGGDLVIRFPDVALAPVLAGHFGLHETLDREGTGAPIELEARLGERVLGTVRHADGEGWKPFSFAIADAAPRGAIELRARAADVSMRHLCFAADLRRP